MVAVSNTSSPHRSKTWKFNVLTHDASPRTQSVLLTSGPELFGEKIVGTKRPRQFDSTITSAVACPEHPWSSVATTVYVVVTVGDAVGFEQSEQLKPESGDQV